MSGNESKKPVHEIPVMAPSDDLWGQASGSGRRRSSAESSSGPSGSSGATAPPPPAGAQPVSPPLGDSGLPPMPPPGAPVPPPMMGSAATVSAPENPYASAPPPPAAQGPVQASATPQAPTASPPVVPSKSHSSEFPAPSMAEQLASVFDKPVPPPAPEPVAAAVPGQEQVAASSPASGRYDPNASTEPSVGALQGLSSDPLTDLRAALATVLPSRGSDLHLASGSEPLIRVDGALGPVPGSAPWPAAHVEGALRMMVGEERWAKFKHDLELDVAYSLSDDERFRVNIYQQRGQVGAAFRLIPTEIMQLGELGIPDVVSRFAKLPRGLVLVTGPTGSGKSTTLAALIDLVNRTRTDHIVTVEDPIEFLHSNKKSLVNQREVGPDTHSFNAALRHVLRQDPDVILIGELRDLETISVALTAAETGHLVFATLHTQDAPQTIDRVIDVFPAHQQPQIRAQLASTLQGVVCQTLIRRASGRGRLVATEIMTMTPAIANLIREGKTYQIHSVMQAGREDGMHTMDQELAELVDAGRITHQAAMQRAHDIENLMQLIHRADPTLTGRVAGGR